MSQEYFVVDAFTNGLTGGNSAGVCIVNEPLESGQMQRIAAELQFSETAFVMPRLDHFELRWFSPKTEVELCGHATLAAAHILWETHRLRQGVPATFATKSGKLSAVRTGNWIQLDFPSLGVKEAPAPADIIEALGVSPVYVGRSRFDLLVHVATEAEVVAVAPQFDVIARAEDLRGVIVTAESTSPEYDFVSRFFAPAVGIDEDPVTGSAHCCLGPYWATILGRTNLTGYQASCRGGIVRVNVLANRVELSGQTVTVGQGEID